MSRRKRASEAVEINVWPSSPPEDIGSIACPDDLSTDCDDLGRRYLTDAVEQDVTVQRPLFGDEYDDCELDLQAADGILRSFGLEPPGAAPRRSGVRVLPPQVRRPKGRSLESLPDDAAEHVGRPDELDLTEQATHDASLLDHEGEEAGEVRSPWLCTEDTRTHGKPRGGHARVGPLALKR